MIQHIKNKVKVSKLFWKFRHLVQFKVWTRYYEDYSSNRRRFYADLVKFKNFTTIFEFGCASGPNLKNIEAYSTRETYCFGFDINEAAIEFARTKFEKRRFFFSKKICSDLLIKQLSTWGFDFFDLAIYDRVLYLLSNDEVNTHFSEFNVFFSTVVIDDFHSDSEKYRHGTYVTKNYEAILTKYGFTLIKNEASGHVARNEFFERTARRLIFVRKKPPVGMSERFFPS